MGALVVVLALANDGKSAYLGAYAVKIYMFSQHSACHKMYRTAIIAYHDLTMIILYCGASGNFHSFHLFTEEKSDLDFKSNSALPKDGILTELSSELSKLL